MGGKFSMLIDTSWHQHYGEAALLVENSGNLDLSTIDIPYIHFISLRFPDFQTKLKIG